MTSSSKRTTHRGEVLNLARVVLEDQLTTSRDLHETLLTERQAITERELDALTRCGEAKLVQLERLESLEVERRQILEALGFADETAEEELELAELWRKVLAELDSCQDANEVNGVMVRTCEAQIQRALDLLAGKEELHLVYEANGIPATGAHPQTIAKV